MPRKNIPVRKNKPPIKKSNRTLIVVGVVAFAVVIGIVSAYLLTTGSVFFPSLGAGKLEVRIIDGNTQEVLTDATYDLYDIDNETLVLRNQTQGTIHDYEYEILAVVNYTGYYAKAVSLGGSDNNTARVNTIALYPLPNQINSSIIKVNDVYGDFDNSSFAFKTNENVTFSVELKTNNTHFGYTCYFPNASLNNESYAYDNGIQWTGLWLAMNCSLRSASVNGYNTTIYKDVTINGNVMQVIQLFSVFNSATEEIRVEIESSANVQMFIYDNFIDLPLNIVYL